MLLYGDPCGIAIWATVVFAPLIGRHQWSFAVAMQAPDDIGHAYILYCSAVQDNKNQLSSSLDSGAGVCVVFGFGTLSSRFGRTRSC